MDGEDFWAGEGSLKGFHVRGRGSLYSSNPLAEIPAFLRNAYSACLQAVCPSLWIHSLVQEECPSWTQPALCSALSQAKGYNGAFLLDEASEAQRS